MKSKPTAILLRLISGMSLLSGLLLGSAAPARAAGTLFVNAAALGANNGTSWANAFTGLQSALAAASPGTAIWVAAGTYRPTAGSDRAATFGLKNGVAVYGGFAGTESLLTQRNWVANLTILSGDLGTPIDASDNSFNVVTARSVDGTAVLDGFTVTGGNANGSGYPRYLGGGMFNENSSATLAHVIFSANSARLGGGMYSISSAPSLSNVTFSGNSAVRSGGGMSGFDSSPVLSRVLFNGNSAGTYGGGMENSQDSSATLTDVTFNLNTAGIGGGGMYNYLSSPSVSRVTFSANSVTDATSQGGAIFNLRSSPSITNVTFSGNSAVRAGGAIHNGAGSNPTLTNVTISGNSAGQAGAIHNYNSNLAAVNSILYGDTGGEVLDEGTSISTVTFSIVQGGFAGTGNLNVNPLLAMLLLNGGPTKTRALKPASPAIDAGDDTACPATDQRGISRPRAAHCDMGAYEYNLIVFVKGDAAGSNNGTSWSNAFKNLQDGFAAALPNGQIWVAAGTYKPTAGPDRTVSFALRSRVAVYGGFNGTELLSSQRDPILNPTILSGDIGIEGSAVDNSYHVVTGTTLAATTVLDGFTIRDGNATGANPDDRGAGMFLFDSSPKLGSLTFTANQATAGGAGMYNDSSHPALSRVTFSDNHAPSGTGGGMYNWASAPSLNGVRFENNAASQGGGVYNGISDATFTNVTLSGNTATDGGGMYNWSSSPALMNMTFSSDLAAASGGGMYNNLSSPSLTNVTFSANQATALDSKGGAIYDETSTVALRNVTLNGNVAASGAIYHANASSGQIENSILWGDSTPEVVVDSSVLLSLLTVNDSIVAGDCPAGAVCTNVLNLDPLLGPLADNGGPTQTLALGTGSPAIDTGADATCALTDQRGIKRPQGPHCDLGAFEVQSYTSSLQSSGTLDGWVLESTETSSLGGSLDSTLTYFLLGDDAANRQYRAILSFDTSTLPATAVITSVTLQIRRASLTGTDPFTTHQYLVGDIHSSFFATSEALELRDFQAAASLGGVFVIKNTPVNSWYSAPLAPTRFSYLNRAGLTQVRLRFKLDDDNDLTADTLTFFSGNAGASSVRPKLVITYYLP